jgi:hypothetical protein
MRMRKILLFLFFPIFLFGAIIKFQNLQKSYYPNQIVNLDVKIILSKENNLTVIPAKNIEANLTKINPYIYDLKLYFQAKNANQVLLIGKNFYKDLNLSKIIHYTYLNEYPNNFSHVFAKSLKVKNVISSKYDKNSSIVSFTILCKDCNLKDFTLPVKDQNLTLVSKNEATYYAIVPKNLKHLNFYYFNLKDQTFEKIHIPIILKEKTISTQTNINPQNRRFLTPLNILTLILIAFLIIIFLVYQKVWLLIFPIIVAILFALQFIPKGSVELKPGTKVTILPTNQSTVIYETNKTVKAEVLNKIKGYTKIEINHKTGWVKDEYIK